MMLGVGVWVEADRFGRVVVDDRWTCAQPHIDGSGWFHTCIRHNGGLEHKHVCKCGVVW